MWALYKLQAKGWISNLFNKMDFIMTALFLAVLGSFIVFKMDGAYEDPQRAMQLAKMNITIISSIVLLMVASSAINTFGMSFFEMRESVLLKRIGATEITKLQAVVSFILWGMTSMLFIVGWMALLVGICQIPFIADATHGLLWVDGSIWAGANWAGVITAIILTMISFYAISFFFVSIAKNAMAYQMIGTFYFFLISFLGGAYTPNADLSWMTFISYMSPLGWGTDLMTASFQGANVFNFGGYEIQPLMLMGGTVENNQMYLDLVNAQVGGDLQVGIDAINDTMPPHLNENGEVVPFIEYTVDADLVGAIFTQDIANTLTAAFTPTEITTFYSIGEFLFPVLYGTLAGGFSAMFFKWD